MGNGIAICQRCAVEFFRRSKGQNKYCSTECQRLSVLQRIKSRRISDGKSSAGAVSKCKRCGSDFHKSHGSQLYCEPCKRFRDAERQKQYRSTDKERTKQIDKRARDRSESNPSYLAWRKAYGARYSKERRKTNPRARLDHRMSTLLRSCFSKSGRTWQSLVGYSTDDLRRHLERQFLPGMAWDNMSDWHVDHILPKSMFHYETENCPEFKACWALTNLRPLWAAQNIQKSNKRTLLI